jgi:ribosomal protein S18 acetylase RimI-like enzyme
MAQRVMSLASSIHAVHHFAWRLRTVRPRWLTHRRGRIWHADARVGELAPDGDAREFGLELARGDTSPISYRNPIVADQGSGAIAGLISYRRQPLPQPISAGSPAITVPWQEVNNGACGAWHIGAITAYPEHRGRGLASEFLRIAEQVRPASGAYAISLLVADTNMGARRLYERFGFREAARRPMAKGHWTNPGVASGF